MSTDAASSSEVRRNLPSVSYGSVDIGLFPQEGKEVKYASADRARKIIAHLPASKIKMLLVPIEQGLLDPQSVFYLIDDKSEDQILAICVEDFVQLVHSCRDTDEEENQPPTQWKGDDILSSDIVTDETVVPPRLLDALNAHLLMSEAEKVYSAIDDEKSSGYSSNENPSRSRGGSDSAFSEGSSHTYMPPLPESRPPTISFSLSLNTSVNLLPNPDSEDAGSWTKRDSFTSTASRMTSILESQPRTTSAETRDSKPSSSLSRRVSLNSSSGINALNSKERREKILHQVSFCRYPVRITVLSVAACLLAVGAAIGVYFLLRYPARNDISTTTTPYYNSNVTYDCVAGSIAKVLLDGALHTLVSLNLSKKLPTHSVQSHEYLFVDQKAPWWHAIKYCTAWCGYLAAINTQEESNVVLEMVKTHQVSVINYWIGFKAWRGAWYLDDESSITFYNFPNFEQANHAINGIDDVRMGCVQGQADDSGKWLLNHCDETFPFVCERNIDDKNIQRTPFHPHQEKNCSQAGGRCKYVTECVVDGKIKRNLCPLQANNIACCIPNKPKPQQLTNSSIQTCAEAGGICNHVDADQCRNGRVVFGLKKPCPDRPRKLDCCVENDI